LQSTRRPAAAVRDSVCRCVTFSMNTMNFDATGPTRPLTRDKSAPPRGACGVECHINHVATSSSKDLSTKASPRYQKVALRQKINNQKQTKQTNRTTSRRQIWDYFLKSKTKNIFILFCEMWYDVEKIFTHINVCVCVRADILIHGLTRGSFSTSEGFYWRERTSSSSEPRCKRRLVDLCCTLVIMTCGRSAVQ